LPDSLSPDRLQRRALLLALTKRSSSLATITRPLHQGAWILWQEKEFGGEGVKGEEERAISRRRTGNEDGKG